jgi:hypothetical protein
MEQKKKPVVRVKIPLMFGPVNVVHLISTPPPGRLRKHWAKIKTEVPKDNGDHEGMVEILSKFWDDVKKKNPFWLPFNLAIDDVDEIQKEIDRLTEKARKKEQFEQDEKDFLVSLYSWIAWGGLIKWYPEACHLLRHYLNGKGQPVVLNPHVYKTSVIVNYAIAEMKKLIVEDIKKTGKIRGNGVFSSQGNLKDTPRSYAEQCEKGAIVKNGTLMAEQNNKRLKNTDNNFPLKLTCSIISTKPIRVNICWNISSIWDYESFERQKNQNLNLVTELPLGANAKLKLPDGLSQYLVTLGLAKKFDYSAEWTEEFIHD